MAVHGRGRRAHERVYVRLRLGVEPLRRRPPNLADAPSLHAEVGQVEPEPHLARDVVAHLTGVLAAHDEAAAYGVRVGWLEREIIGQRERVG